MENAFGSDRSYKELKIVEGFCNETKNVVQLEEKIK